MNFTATDLFPDWYQKGINKDVTTEELAIRKGAILEIITITDKTTWINVLKVYLGICKFECEEYNQVVEFVRKGDENFQVQNENLVRTIAGCAIGQKIDQNDHLLSDVLSLGLICSETLPNINHLIPELLARANNFWLNECEKNRQVDLDFKIGSLVSTSEVKVEIPELSPDQTTWKANSDAVIKIIKALQKDLTVANQEIILQQQALKSIKTNFNALFEETNVLWWLFRTYSSIAKKQFNELNSETLSVVAAFELFDLTSSYPGIGGIDGIISKALTNSANHIADQTMTIDSVIESVITIETGIKVNLSNELQELRELTPLLTAIRCGIEYSDGWKAIFKKQSTLQVDLPLTCKRFSLYLYKELMFIEIFENI